jgi:uncharacterized Zn-binding protein involved in type VI secretion
MRDRKKVLEAAAVGHRITHGKVEDARDMVATAATVGAGLALVGEEPELAAALLGVAILAAAIDGEAPRSRSSSGEVKEGSEDTFIGKERRAAALVGLGKVPCKRCVDEEIEQGSPTVLVNGKPLARRMDEVGCGAKIGEGEKTVLVGADPPKKKERRPQTAAATEQATSGLDDLTPWAAEQAVS